MSDFAVISCLFNPGGFRRPCENLTRFTKELKRTGCPYYLVELGFPGREFFMPAAENVWQYRSSSVLWHKEKLLNLAAAKLPSQVEKICWLDADVLFSDPHWWHKASRLLDEFVVIQPFETADWLDREGESVERSAHGYVAAYHAQPPNWAPRRFRYYHPGFAWAARREFFERGGLFCRHVVGGGDAILALSLIKRADRLSYIRKYSRKLFQLIKEYEESLYWINGSIGYVPDVKVGHLWHGALSDRGYIERNQLLTRYDPLRDIAEDENGVWRWASAKPELHEAVKRYFLARREDGDPGRPI
jgi:hypothetical protein